MEFTIDGRIQVAVRPDEAAWTVQSAQPAALPTRDAVARFAELERNDIGSYLDLLCQELGVDD